MSSPLILPPSAKPDQPEQGEPQLALGMRLDATTVCVDIRSVFRFTPEQAEDVARGLLGAARQARELRSAVINPNPIVN